MGLKFLTPGMLTTVQDAGRYGYQASGFGTSGAADLFSMRIANILVGNDPDEAALEMTMLGATVAFTSDAVVALTGADMDATLNGTPVPSYAAIAVAKGDVLKCGFAKTGLRAYLAVAGGFYLKPVMNSRSTNLKVGIGGYLGRAAKSDDLLFFNTTAPKVERIADRKLDRNRYFPKGEVVRVVKGPQYDAFTEEGARTFFGATYTLTPDSDRMGIKLDGPAIESKNGSDIISDGIPLGGIQIPKSGKPIVMIADRQTTGGYAKIATALSVDIPLLAQKKPGETVKFKAVPLWIAHLLYRFRRHQLKRIQRLWNR